MRLSREFCSYILDRAFENGSEILMDGTRVVRGDMLGSPALASRDPRGLFLVALGKEPIRMMTSSDMADLLEAGL